VLESIKFLNYLIKLLHNHNCGSWKTRPEGTRRILVTSPHILIRHPMLSIKDITNVLAVRHGTAPDPSQAGSARDPIDPATFTPFREHNVRPGELQFRMAF